MFGRFRRVAGALGAAAVLVISMSTAPAGAGPIESPNLLVNPGAEFGDPSLTGYSSVSIPGWTVTRHAYRGQIWHRRKLAVAFVLSGATFSRAAAIPALG
ncbi:hypothetical protein [Mycobacterium sp.]|uniref:hypothetical protein n=1 Tax=Mycobacterium sp. TaxID=1785 RepID=UPI003F9A7DB4